MNGKQISIFIHSVRQIDSVFKGIFIVALVALINYECRIVPLLWVNKYTIGINAVLVQILYSYITGFLFYFFIELLHQNKKRIAIFRLVNNKTHIISRRINDLLNEICLIANRSDQNYKVKIEQFSEYCEKINIHSTPVELLFFRSSVHDFVLRICEDIRNSTDDIITHADLFDADWINCLTNINDSISQIQHFLNLNGPHSTLNLVSYWIWNLYSEEKNLSELGKKYFKENFKINLDQTKRFIPPDLVFEVKVKA